MFPRPVPTSDTQPFVRHDFLGLIRPWVPVRMVSFIGGDQAGGHGHGRQQKDRLLQQEQEARRDTGK